MPARILGPADAEIARAIVATDPVANVFTSSRLDAGVLWPSVGATLWGWPAEAPRHLLHVGSNLVPVFVPAAGDRMSDVVGAFVEAAGPRRGCQAMVGESTIVLALHQALSRRYTGSWARVRELRPTQPVMVAQEPVSLAPAPVAPIGVANYESYVAAAVAMYTEEVGQDPLALGGRSAYRAHCRSLLETGRAFGIVTDGHVVFKADVGASSGGIAQVQGVWLAPHLRGRGLAAPAMAAATDLIRETFPTVALYVNDFNQRAVRTYLRCGYRQVNTFSTVLY